MPAEDIRFDTTVVRAFVAFARIAGWIVVLLALAVLLTWVVGAGPLRGILQSEIGSRAGAALVALLAALALLLGQRMPRISVGLSLLVALSGGIELFDYVYDFLLPAGDWTATLLPDWPDRPQAHMTAVAALAFVLLGVVGIAVALGRYVWLREVCALAVIAIAMTAGASYGLVLAGDSVDLLTRLPIMTAALLLLLALAWMSQVPTTGLTRVAVADSPGGAFARRLILPSLFLPVLLTFAFRGMQLHFDLSESLTLALAAVSTGGAVATMIVWVAVLLDRGERQRRAVVALREDAATDALTGLANRRALDAALAKALDAGEPFALLMLDLDHFKRYNDSFGHQAGDAVLRETGHLLHAEVRPRDLVARYGGEEFVIVLPKGDALRAERVAQRVLAAFRATAWPHRAVTVSIGVTVAVAGDVPETLLRRADEALYRSKQEGRDRYCLATEAAQCARAQEAVSAPRSATPRLPDA